MRIGMLGSGLMGGKLGTIFAKAVPSERIARYYAISGPLSPSYASCAIASVNGSRSD